MHESVRVVLFDAVGTVIHPVPGVDQVYAAAGRRHGSRQDDAATIQRRFRQAFARHDDHGATSERHERRRWRRIVADVFDDVPDAAESLFTELWDHFANPNHWSLYDDVLPTWRSLRRQDLVIGIASNFDARLEGICRALQPLDQADHVFCSSGIGFSKPRPEFYAHVVRALGLEPGQILMIGDSLANDVEAARTAGWQAVWLRRDGAVPDRSAIGGLAEITR